jgi:fucose permease
MNVQARESGPDAPVVHLKAALAVNYAAMLSLAIAVNLMPVFLTTLRTGLGGAHGLSNEQLGRIGAASFFGVILGISIASPLAGRGRTQTLPAVGNLIIMIGLGTLGFAPSYTVVLFAVFLMGLGAGILDMILSPIVCALQPDRRTQAMNWLHSFYCLGAMFTVLGAAFATRIHIDWRTTSLLLTSIPIAIVIAFFRVKLPPLTPGAGMNQPVGKVLANPQFLAALGAIFLGGATELGLAQWLPAYAESGLGFSKWTGSMALFGFSGAMTAGRLVAGFYDRRWGSVPLLLRCCGVSVILFVIASFAPPHLALAASIAVGFTASCLWPTMLGVAADWFPEGGVVMFGMLAVLGNLGGVFMPWLVGVMADVSSIRIGLSTATLCPLLMMWLLWWMRRHRRQSGVCVS